MATERRKTTSKKAARKKTAAKKTVAKPQTAPRKQAAAKKTTPSRRPAPARQRQGKTPAMPVKKPVTAAVDKAISHQQRYEMIETMAYFLAEKRGFEPGGHERDWLESERVIDEMLQRKGVTLHP